MSAGPIVHVVQHLRPGGLEVMALELARAQAARHPAVIVSLEGEADDAIAAWPRLRAHKDNLRFLGKRPGVDPALPARLARLFGQLRPACVHTHHVGPLLYAGTAAHLAGVPSRLHTEHDAWHLQDRRRRRLMKLALRLARPRVVADAPHVADAFAAALGGRRPQVVLNGVDTQRFTPGDRAAARDALGLPADAAVIGIAARLERVKGVDIGIAALAAMSRVAVLAIAGDGSEREALVTQAKALGVANRVRFMGPLSDTVPFFRALDLLCVPSRNEGLPLAPLEAQACGVRVVAANVGGVATGVCPRSGALVAAEDEAALARALDSALVCGAQVDPREFVLRNATLEAAATAYLDLSLSAGAA